MKEVSESSDTPSNEPSVARLLTTTVIALIIICILLTEGMQQLDSFFRWMGY